MSAPPAPGSVTATRGEIVAGAAWMLLFKATERLLGLVSTLVLVRLLAPSDFGVMAMAMSMIAILDLLRSFSFDVAIIQRRDVDRTHLDTAWTFNLIFGVVVSALMLVLAAPAAAYYREGRIEQVLWALAGAWLVQSFESIGPVAFRRELQFSKEYRFLVAKKLASVLVTVPLAFWLRSYWALVIGVVVGRCLSVLISYWMHHYRPRVSLAAARELIGVSGWLLVNNVLYFFNERLTDLVIGRVAGARALGLYSVSFEISNMPTTEIVAPINRALLPGYSKIARESGQLAQTYLDSVGVLALFSMPAGVGIAVLADPLVRLLLGPNWLAAIALVQVLGLYGAIASIGTSTASALLAVGRQRALTQLAALRLGLLIPALVWATTQYGILGAAWSVFVVTAVVTPINFTVLMPALDVRMRAFVACLWRPPLASTVMAAAVAATLEALAARGVSHAFVQLVCCSVVGALTYLAATGILWKLSGGGALAPEGMVVRAVVSRLRGRMALGQTT